MNIPLRYHDRRLEGETPLRQCQLVQLHLLYVFDAICKEHHLTYFLDGGTLLGAMRHQGFIPWDDDLDVGMPMEDYKRFLKIAPKFLPQDVLLQAPDKDRFMHSYFSKLRDTSSFYGEPGLLSTKFSGIFLDIFPYEVLPEIGNFLQLFFLRAIGHCWRTRRAMLIQMGSTSTILLIPKCLYTLLLELGYYTIRFTLGILKRIFPCKSVYIALETGYRFHFNLKDLFPLTKAAFEDGIFPVPNKADTVLSAQYGNWRQVPPLEKRPRHAHLILPMQSISKDYSCS